jgi:hypothetical protein
MGLWDILKNCAENKTDANKIIFDRYIPLFQLSISDASAAEEIHN